MTCRIDSAVSYFKLMRLLGYYYYGDPVMATPARGAQAAKRRASLPSAGTMGDSGAGPSDGAPSALTPILIIIVTVIPEIKMIALYTEYRVLLCKLQNQFIPANLHPELPT